MTLYYYRPEEGTPFLSQRELQISELYQLAWPQLETQLGQNSAWAKATTAFIFMSVCLCVCITRQAYLFLKSYSDPFNQKTSFTKCF